jgi:hypothetical protein
VVGLAVLLAAVLLEVLVADSVVEVLEVEVLPEVGKSPDFKFQN